MKSILITSFISLIFLFSACTDEYQKEDNHRLLELINTRLEVAPLVAKSKWNTKAPINDSIREKIILDNVETEAIKLGLDKHFAREFFKAQFEAGKTVQIQLHEKWNLEQQPPFTPSINLATEVRPILDSLTPLLLLELKNIQSSKKLALDKLKYDARRVISTSFDVYIIDIAIKPIETYIQKNNH